MATGRTDAEFWTLTPREIALVLEAEADRRHDQHELTAWAVWHVAILGRVRRFPPLRKIMPRRRRRGSPQQTGWQHQLKIVEMINLQLGGEPRRKVSN